MAAETTERQQGKIRELCAEHGATQFIVERDEPHDGHVFVTLYHADGPLIGEWIVEADGTIDGEE